MQLDINQKPTTQPASGWRSNLKLVYGYSQGATNLVESYNQAPLKVQRPFYPEGKDICHSVILHTAGGVVGGDELSINCHLQPHAKALITTAAASKIYRSNGLNAQQSINIQVDSGAILEWLPQETIVFNEAIYRQNIRVELAPEASFMGWEITRFGRSARGEKFLEGEWRSYTEIWREGKPLWIDRQCLSGNEDTFSSCHGLAGQPIAGSFVWVGQPVVKEVVMQVRNLWQGEGECGASRLENGLLCRYRGNSTAEVRNWFIGVWQLLRGRGGCVPRVWQL